MMRHAWVRREGIVMLVGVLSPSVGVVFMADTVGAVPPTKSGSKATQNWDRVLPEDKRVTVLAAFGGAVVLGNETGLMREQSLMR